MSTATLTREERTAQGKQRAADAIARLDAGIVAVMEDNEAFREYLRCSARLHKYSAGNRMLIHLQRPDTRMVAGFNDWRDLERPVVKGSKGIQILAPCKRTIEDRDTGERRTFVAGFRVAYVFAVEDTDGPEIGTPDVILPADDSPAAAAYADTVAGVIRAQGIALDIRHADPLLGNSADGRPAGYWSPGDGRGSIAGGTLGSIVVNGDLPAAQRFKVLAHELAHALADHSANEDNRRDAEAVAEGTAFIVAAHCGMDTAEYSAPYIAGWAQDIARVRALLERIGKLSAQIIDLMEGN